ncbi:MAG: hypothetical protein QOG84_464 [Sphingomonadales bacterium]|jgi:hypothetical protein|nr:hypothetical protein [Sphingomonadales bacterium]
MTYPSWAAMHEGPTDEAYFDVIIPRLMEELVAERGTRNVTIPLTPAVRLGKSGRAIAEVAEEACREQDAFFILFIHADTGGRALEADIDRRSTAYCDAVNELCGFPQARCVVIAPRHETEAWMLADRDAVGSALGYRGNLGALGLPANAAGAERLVDPKQILEGAILQVRGRRSAVHVQQIIPAIAQRQDFSILRQSRSFRAFAAALAGALIDLGCIA